MGSSDSDTENECFESAEESLDEKEELEDVKRKSQRSLKSREREIVEPAPDCDPVDSKCLEEKRSSTNSLSFRKRPERVKRLPNKTPTRSTSKSPSSEVIFKADKIVPDVFFQDITSNLTKNINKSLSTLQQKSSNVKDLIFSSLPSSSGTERTGFSYDDKSAIIPPDECGGSDLGADLQNVDQPVNEISEKTPEEQIINKKETLVESLTKNISSPVDKLTEIKKEGKPPNSPCDKSEDKFQGDYNLLGDAAAKGDVCNFSKEKPDVNPPDSSASKDNNLIMENVPEERKESFKNSSDTNSEVVVNQEVSAIEENKANPVNVSENKNQENKCVTDAKEIKPSGKEENSNFETNLETTVKEKNVSSVTADSNNLIDTGGIIKDFNDPSEEISEVKSEGILKELKTALKNIVGEDKVNDNNSNINNNEALKEEPILEEKKNEIDESSKDGWDDFDFSDNEPEDIVNASSSTLEEKKENINEEVKDKKSDPESRIEKADKKDLTEKSKEPDLQSKNVHKNAEHVPNESEAKQFTEPEPEPVPDDGWDWEDWDETSQENEKEKADVPGTEKPKSKNTEEDVTSDVSKWSGWDTFGQKQEKQGNWGLGSWGVDVLLNKATAVTQGISNVLEAGLGAPDPETLARMEKIEKEKRKEEGLEENDAKNEESHGEVLKKNSLTNVNIFPVAGLTSLVAGVTSKIVEHSKIQEIGSKVITGGLDTLETFGKKTMEVLQEGDPGLKNKRALLLGNNKPVLSQVLREAREKADRESKQAEEKELAKKCHFETLFDDFQGMIHLEALEMLSTQCELKLEQIRSGMNSEEQEELNGIFEEIQQLCSLEEWDTDLKFSMLDFKTALQMAVEPLKNEISTKKITEIYEHVSTWLQTSTETPPSFIVLNQKFVATLAELTAATIQQFHKSGELLSVKECRKTVEEVDALSRLTDVLCLEIKRICEKFINLCQKTCSKKTGDDSAESFAKKAVVVMENSTSYIRQAFDLLIPVIELGAAA